MFKITNGITVLFNLRNHVNCCPKLIRHFFLIKYLLNRLKNEGKKARYVAKVLSF